MIEVKHISKIYNKGNPNEFRALDDISLTVAKGEMVAIMGKSGAGKSTLLHIIGTLENFDDGEYLFDNDRISGKKDRELSIIRGKSIGFVLQDYGLILGESVLSNVLTPLYFDRTPIKAMKKVAEEALAATGILELKKKLTRDLSGGQKQRVAIARSIVNHPQILLADEPTGSLDSKTALDIMNLFKTLNQEGKTIIIVTHSEEVASYCQRIIRIADGKIVTEGKSYCKN